MSKAFLSGIYVKKTEGYREGFDKGYQEGFDKGYQEGFNRGLDEISAEPQQDEKTIPNK